MFNSILVVCIGNICRSPIGERLLAQALPNKKVSSAGIAAVVGATADPKSVEVSAENGISLDGHIAKQLTRKICSEFDLILVMEDSHIDKVCRIAPEARGKVMLFSYWLGCIQIADPYKKEKIAFERAFSLLKKSTDKWIEKLA